MLELTESLTAVKALAEGGKLPMLKHVFLA